MEFERRRHNHSYLNIAPLVDVVFLLLLFFMLTSHLIREPAIRIRLPAAATSRPAVEDTITVHVTAGGAIFVGDQPVDLEHLGPELRDLVDESSRRVRIKADRSVDVGLFVGVIDGVRGAGVEQFSLATEKE